MGFSPRQVAAWLELGRKRQGRALAERVTATRLAMHGDKRDVEKAIKDWLK